MRALWYAFVCCFATAFAMVVWVRRVWREIAGTRVA